MIAFALSTFFGILACAHPPEAVVWVAPDESPLLALDPDGIVSYPSASVEVGRLEGDSLRLGDGRIVSVAAASGADPVISTLPDGGLAYGHQAFVVQPGGSVLVDGKPYGEMRPGLPLDERHAALLVAWSAFRPPLGIIASLWEGSRSLSAGVAPRRFGVHALPDGRIVEPDDLVCSPGPDCQATLHVIGSWTANSVTVEGRSKVIAETVLAEDGGCRVEVGVETVHFDGKQATIEGEPRGGLTADLLAIGGSQVGCEDPVTRAALAGLAARMVTRERPSGSGMPRGLFFGSPLVRGRTEKTVDDAVMRSRGELLACTAHPPSANVEVALTLGDDGRPSQPPEITSNDGAPAELEACILRVMSKLDAGPGAACTATIPMLFSSGDEGGTRLYNAWP